MEWAKSQLGRVLYAWKSSCDNSIFDLRYNSCILLLVNGVYNTSEEEEERVHFSLNIMEYNVKQGLNRIPILKYASIDEMSIRSTSI